MKKLLLLATLLLLTSDAWATNKYPVIVGKSLNCTGYTGTLTHNAFTLTISGSITFVAGMTYTSTVSSNININATGTFTTAGKLIGVFGTAGTSTVTLGDDMDFVASKLCAVTLGSTSTLDLNGFTMAGNSATNRLLIKTGTLGTARPITVSGGTFENADFRDVTLNVSTDLSAITGLSGDCGGNTNITFTTAATQTWDGTTGNWSTSARWTSRVPLPQDDVNVAASSAGTLTADMPRLGKSIDFTGGGALTLTFGTSNTLYGSMTFISAMTVTGAQGLIWECRTTANITSAGKTWPNSSSINLNIGTYSLQDAFVATNILQLNTAATLTTNNFSVSVSNVSFSSTSAATYNLGSSTITLTGTGSNTFNPSSSGVINAGTSTILLSDISATSKTFAGQGKTYNNLSISGGGAGAVIITGANTFADFYMNPSVAGTKTIQFTAATTTTFGAAFNGFDNGTNVWTISSVTAATHTLSKTSGAVCADYLNLTNSIATGGANFSAGANSTDNGGNSGWAFTGCPFQSSRLTLLGVG